eukprot:scaffold40167_cov150-Skeletonema_dohrnii-CCMP3373.AAC.1
MRDSYAQEFYQIDSQPLLKAALNPTEENDAHQDESREESNERREAIESSIDDVCGREEVDAEDVGCSIDTEPPAVDTKETKKRVTFSEDVMMWAYSFYEAASSLEEDDDDDSSHKYSHKHKRNIFDVVFCVSYKCACEIVD